MCGVLSNLNISLAHFCFRVQTISIFTTLLVALLLVLKHANCLFNLLICPLGFLYLRLRPL